MDNYRRKDHEYGNIDGKYAVFLKIGSGSVGTINCGHEVGIVAENRQDVETQGSCHKGMLSPDVVYSKQGQSPRSASNKKVRNRTVNPKLCLLSRFHL